VKFESLSVEFPAIVYGLMVNPNTFALQAAVPVTVTDAEFPMVHTIGVEKLYTTAPVLLTLSCQMTVEPSFICNVAPAKSEEPDTSVM
jgi:hypothetical protein